MNSLMRPVLLAGFVCILGACFLGLRFACSPVDVSAFQHSEELERMRRATNRRLEDRRDVVRAVIERRCTLAEALAQLQELDHEWPDYHERAPEVPDEGSVDERTYCFIRSEVEEYLHNRPEELATVLHRLKKEYLQRQTRGFVTFPVPIARSTLSR